jgi:NarL family two-component system sensor histidine kinase LiaS
MVLPILSCNTGFWITSGLTAMDFQKILKPIKKLQWKLTISYTSVTVGSLVVVVLILSYLLFSYVLVPYQILDTALSPEAWINIAATTTSEKWQYILSQDPIDKELVSLSLQDNDLQVSFFDILQIGDLQVRLRTLGEGSVLIVDPDGIILGTSNPDFLAEEEVGTQLDLSLLPELDRVFVSATSGEITPSELFVTIKPYEEFYFAVPQIDGMGEDVLAVSIVYFQNLPNEGDLPMNIGASLGKTLLLIILSAGIVGTIFGAITAKGMVARLRQVSRVTDAWSKGDFSEFIDDPLGDEISQLARQLNFMADQLQELLERKQDMAVSEERNRLARELHDSAKQEALAASLQLGTALTLLESNPGKAKKHLQEAETLVDSVRIELTDLIHELRPGTIEGRSFPEVLNDYLIDWAHQNDVAVNLGIDGEFDIPLDHKQTIYRILQEGLANVARHSQANQVWAALKYAGNQVEFTLQDDGIGFTLKISQAGFGLRSMRERVEKMDGKFWVESTPNQGTLVKVTLPINRGDTNDG